MNILNDLSRINKLIFNKSNLYFLLLIIVIFTFDRITKNFIIKSFVEEIFYLNKFINLDLVWNIGIGFGLLSYDSLLVIIADLPIRMIFLINMSIWGIFTWAAMRWYVFGYTDEEE